MLPSFFDYKRRVIFELNKSKLPRGVIPLTCANAATFFPDEEDVSLKRRAERDLEADEDLASEVSSRRPDGATVEASMNLQKKVHMEDDSEENVAEKLGKNDSATEEDEFGLNSPPSVPDSLVDIYRDTWNREDLLGDDDDSEEDFFDNDVLVREVVYHELMVAIMRRIFYELRETMISAIADYPFASSNTREKISKSSQRLESAVTDLNTNWLVSDDGSKQIRLAMVQLSTLVSWRKSMEIMIGTAMNNLNDMDFVYRQWETFTKFIETFDLDAPEGVSQAESSGYLVSEKRIEMIETLFGELKEFKGNRINEGSIEFGLGKLTEQVDASNHRITTRNQSGKRIFKNTTQRRGFPKKVFHLFTQFNHILNTGEGWEKLGESLSYTIGQFCKSHGQGLINLLERLGKQDVDNAAFVSVDVVLISKICADRLPLVTRFEKLPKLMHATWNLLEPVERNDDDETGEDNSDNDDNYQFVANVGRWWDIEVDQRKSTLDRSLRLLGTFQKQSLLGGDFRVKFSGSDALGIGPTLVWINKFLKEVFEPEAGYFEYSDDRKVYMKPSVIDGDRTSKMYRQIGRVFGMAIRKSIPLGVPLTKGALSYFQAPVVDRVDESDDTESVMDMDDHDDDNKEAPDALQKPKEPTLNEQVSKWFSMIEERAGNDMEPEDNGSSILEKVSPILSTEVALDWLLEEDPAVHQSLINLYSADWADSKVRDAMSYLTFDGLVAGGDAITIDADNVELYIHMKAESIVIGRKAMIDITRGVYDIIPYNQLSVLNLDELRNLVCGVGYREIDVGQFQASTTVTGLAKARINGYEHNIDWFWSIVGGLSQEDLHLLIEFVSGMSQPPIHGFRGLSGDAKWMSISMEAGLPKNGLPQSQLCFKQLRLPYYSSRFKMRKMLLFAIRHANTVETK
jgi:hypothetical protein